MPRHSETVEMPASIDDYPKVLIVAQDSMDRVDSYGIWTSSLFGSWPREKLAQLVYQSIQHRTTSR